MKTFAELCSRAARLLAGAIGSFLLWTLWLALALLLVLQLYILTANELAVPDVALRQIESRLAASGLRASFGRTSFDPTGRVLVEQVQLSLPIYSEPVVTAGAVFVQLDPWMLALGQFEPTEIRVTNARILAPAMLSPTGRTEELVGNLELRLEPGRDALQVRQLSARVLGVAVTARGAVPTARRGEQRPLDRLAAEFARRFPALCRQAIAGREHLQDIDAPSLELDLAPSESGAATIQVTALAGSVRIEKPMTALATNVRATTRLLLFGDAPASQIDVEAGELDVPGKGSARGVRARVFGRLRPEDRQFDWREAAVTIDDVTAQGVHARALWAQVFPRPLPRIEAHVVGRIVDSPLAFRIDADLGTRNAVVQAEGTVSSTILDAIGERFRVDVRRSIDFDALFAERAEVRLGPDWAFSQLSARVRLPRLNARGVTMEDGRAHVELDRERFRAPEAFARIGENFARGSYEQDLASKEFRFLLDGRLRPLDISDWFRDWWSNFFRQLEFPSAPPDASVDVRGVWREGARTSVFVFADVPHVTWRATALERVRTRLFIRPGFFDGLELLATRGNGAARGRFTYTLDLIEREWRSFDVDAESTLDLDTITRLVPRGVADVLAPFQLAAAPTLTLTGTFAGPAAPESARHVLRIAGKTRGDFRFHHFPLQDVSFAAALDGDQLVLNDVEGRFGGGRVSGQARLSGLGTTRRLGFDVTLRDASLGHVAAGLSEYFAAQKGQPPAPPGKYVKEKADVRLDLAASAEGHYNDPFDFHGDGNAVLKGAEIGEVPLLGLLSELLKFTALRFREARGNFKIDGPRLIFPQLTVTGSNSAIDAHGVYRLDRRDLDFNAKIYPFGESENVIKTVVGAVLTPLSSAFEVKLTGTFDKPEWAFAKSPTTLLRSLAPAEQEPQPETRPPAAPPPAP